MGPRASAWLLASTRPCCSIWSLLNSSARSGGSSAENARTAPFPWKYVHAWNKARRALWIPTFTVEDLLASRDPGAARDVP